MHNSVPVALAHADLGAQVCVHIGDQCHSVCERRRPATK